MKRLALLSALLAGCSTMTNVTPVGQDRYMVGYQVRGGLTSWGEVKERAVLKATEFCTAKSQKIEVLNIETSGAQGWSPQNADVTFKCV